MCTVSYIPVDTGFILTSNRDENPSRETSAPQKIQLDTGEELTAPVDLENKGTWIAVSNKNRVACLLNGAFIKHERKLPYRMSRGQIVLDSFRSKSFTDFINDIDLHNIEPFTLVLADETKLQVLIWDGSEKHHQNLDINKTHLWSSSTLYTREVHNDKLTFFNNFIEKSDLKPESILELHGLNYDNIFILNKEQVKTVSITQTVINKITKVAELTYNLKRESIEV